MNLSSNKLKNISICFVHDWLVAMRGGEKVLETLAELFPEAPIYTLFAYKEKLSASLRNKKIHTSFLQWIPGIQNIYRWLLPIFPLAIRSLNLKKYDLVISSSHCVAKAVSVKEDALHVCYCHTPMRYLWGFEEEYLGKFLKPVRFLAKAYFSYLRKWDVKTSKKVDHFIANSKNTAEKIERLYGKPAKVIYPPVSLSKTVPGTAGTGSQNLSRNIPGTGQRGGYYLIVSALVPYKRVDLAIEAMGRINKPLKIIGDGPLRSQLEKLARSKDVQFVGWVDEKALLDYYANARALIFPGEEDFGIVPLEAQIFGKPVIAYGKGGVTESVIARNGENRTQNSKECTGVFFFDQNVENLVKAVEEFERLEFDPVFIRAHAERFGVKRFKEEVANILESYLENKEIGARGIEQRTSKSLAR